jgi:thiamine biosynthesis lipoprotein
MNPNKTLIANKIFRSPAPRIPELLALVVALGLLAPGCVKAPTRSGPVTIAGETMGTTYTVKLFLPDDSLSLSEIGNLIAEELELINVQMSTYRADSEISRFNASDSVDWFPVSAATSQVVELALEVHQQTEGRFDVTVGPLVNLWGFGPSKTPEQMPAESDILQLLPAIGSDKLEVRSQPPSLKKVVSNLQIDLSAIAKGHGVDRLAAVLESANISDYMVEVGGEIRAKGQRGDGRAWQVGIERPSEQNRELMQVIPLTDLSMATSGDYRNLRRWGESKFSHFIDPKTGWPVQSEIASATVLAEDCATADAVATGLMSCNLEQALELINLHQWSVLLIVRRGDSFESIASPEFQRLVQRRTDNGI